MSIYIFLSVCFIYRRKLPDLDLCADHTGSSLNLMLELELPLDMVLCPKGHKAASIAYT